MDKLIEVTSNAYISHWVKNHPLNSEQRDCVTAVMLKILDGKCKMCSEEKLIMTELYDQVKAQPGVLLTDEIHQLIAVARNNLTDEIKDFIYEKRVLAETAISRPVMKKFKAMIRQQGLFKQML